MADCKSEKTVIIPDFLEVFFFKIIFKALDILYNFTSNISLFFSKKIFEHPIYEK